MVDVKEDVEGDQLGHDAPVALPAEGEEDKVGSRIGDRGLGTNVFTTQQCNHCLIKDSKGSEV